ncbi:S26 family signal peptidase [Solwaraspora sp. WMMD1047]|uniref:S26 family signal peptidase n=1 Tax=Solwaraspora sp. WMMD1047 TaxID=3016102 RepID=UPI002415F205|nr:S26 family signal peptidase [Solwaraspora sp. WMMD1047]MDG4828966.1 S26 family signal peptidase [Solwaraspora sp. WMMD1047]
MNIEGHRRTRRFRITVIGLVGLTALAAALAAARRRLVVIEVVGDSMAPTYRAGDRLLVRHTRRFRVGDVVLAHHQEGGRRDAGKEPLATAWLVKRLAALPGHPVPPSVRSAVGGGGSVPAGSAVLLGEAPSSADSRSWGFVPLDDIAGVVVTRLTTGRPMSDGAGGRG